ncbi:MAG: DEAD/DEAH box helicase [Burkholderiales bacterium]|nr:MAG: DEAD/DEAH box helicase [Burkholderiales bacterium]
MTQFENSPEQYDDAASVEATFSEPADLEPTGINGFAQFNLNPALLSAVESLGYTAPTGVQAQTIPASLKGGDWMVSAQTGSGKTAAFLLPAIHALLANPTSKGEELARKRRASASPRVLILAPTRELAQQVAQEAIRLVRFCKGVRIANVVGGTAFGKQLMDLRGATLVVATPGRLLDLHRHGQIDLDAVQTLVVDEADRMLDLGFSEDLEAIHLATGKRERTLMFSATFAPRIMELASHVMRNPQRIELATAQDTHANIEQRLHWFDDMAHKNVLLEHYLSDEAMQQAIVFSATQVEADELAEELREAGYSASALHGAMPQALRNRRITSLREGKIKILVATDVAARGIDVPTISLVVNYGLPLKPEDYVHRIGRTGRAGRDGLAITLAGARDRFRIRNIESYTQRRLEVATVEGHEPQTNPQMGSKFGPRRGAAPRGPRFEREPRSEGGSSFGHSNFGGARDAAPRFDAPQDARPERREGSGERASPYSSPYKQNNDRGFARPGGDRDSFSRGRSDSAPRFHRESGFADRRSSFAGRRDEGNFARPAFDANRGGERRFEARAEPRFEPRAEPRFEPRSDTRFARREERPANDFGGERRPNFAAPTGERKFAHQARTDRRGDKPAGPSFTPPADGGNRAARRAHLQAQYEAKLALSEG